MKSFPQAAAREAAGPLLVKLRDRYGESMEVNIYDPRCYFWIFDLIRFRVKSTEAAWVFDGKLLFRGIPAWEDLERAIAAKVGVP